MKNVFFILAFVVVLVSTFVRLKWQEFDKNNSGFVLAQNNILDSNFDSKKVIESVTLDSMKSNMLSSTRNVKEMDSMESGELQRLLKSRVLNNPPNYSLDSKGEIILPDSEFKIIPNLELQVHASAIVGLNSKLMVLFYAGTREGDADVKIYQSFLPLDYKQNTESTNLDSKKLANIEFIDSKINENFQTTNNIESNFEDSIKNTKSTNLDSKKLVNIESNITQNSHLHFLCQSIPTLPPFCKINTKNANANFANIQESRFYKNTESNNKNLIKLANIEFIDSKINENLPFESALVSKSRQHPPIEKLGQIQRANFSTKQDSIPTINKTWSKPRAILTKQDLERLTGKYFRKLGNPIVFKDKSGKLHCFVVGVSLGGWATSKVYQFEFDASYNLVFKGELHLSPLGNMSYLVRTPAINLQNGGFMLPLAHEMFIKYPLVAYFDSNARLRFTQKINDLKFHLQPSIMPLSNTECIGIFRSYLYEENPPMMTQICSDFGNIWHSPKASNLTNHDASSVLIAFENNGRQEILLAHNDTSRKNLSLYYLVDSNLQDSKNLQNLDSKNFTTQNMESNPTFKKLFLIDLQDGEISYPAMFVDNEYLHITYTFYRKNIAYKRIKLSTIAKLIELDSKNHK
ncbi:hypothetical protein DCO58_00400 [Helicobacter saguini]|uniref:Sialidase domain-containing protein n=1 Tax=Helicobacter saguini TaxID=1548018 RepID=A0A4U8TBA0_9HELI|nr:exo-alpha-sialidase [Helicobacter saguini]MWV63147.1 hypothetical protein [Helicobacter saguini]MWV66183.1 hypothetical protein [Helicobacter saguini]MWV68532.1 hypothetical protein [Helicobacter saguini]MWV71913.1 hypothetical protein [Helicobacter saguini]TLD95927.1 hypothetical protein LS64_000755 [Helicobacter saguini]